MELNVQVKNKTNSLLAYGLVSFFLLALFFMSSSSTFYAAAKNQAASISAASIPKNLKPSKIFRLAVTAKDDKAVTGIKIKYLNKIQVIKARARGKKVLNFTINLKAPRAGKQRIEITALDGSKLQSKVKIIIVDVNRTPTVKVTTLSKPQQVNVISLGNVRKPIKKITKPVVLSSNTTVKDLEVFVKNQKAMGRTIFQVATLLKNGRVAGDKAYQVLLNVYNSPVEFVAGIMRATGYGLSSFVRKFSESAKSKTLGWLFKALLDAGFELDEITFDLKGVRNFSLQAATQIWQTLGQRENRVMRMLKERFGIDAENAFAYMKNAGYSLAAIVNGLKTVFSANANDIIAWAKVKGYSAIDITQAIAVHFSASAESFIGWLANAGYPAADVVSAIKGKFNPTGRQMIKWMKDANYSTNTIIKVMKSKFNSDAVQIAGWLKDAGFSAVQITNGLKNNFSTSASQMIRLLFDLGYSLNQIKAAVASAFSMGLLQVGSLIVSLGL